MFKNAGAIIRVSTPGQKDNTSQDTQITEILEAATKDGFQIDKEKHIWVVVESGKKKLGDRYGLTCAKKAVENQEIERLYVYNVKRLSRNMTTGLLFIEEMNRLGCEIYNIATQKILSRYDLGFLLDLMLAEKDGNDIVEQTYKGLKKVVREGIYSGGIVAYGYKLNPLTKKLEINENEAKIVRLIYQLCTEDSMSCTKIADYLNARNIKTKFSLMPQPQKGQRRTTKGIWRYGRIRNMIVNSAYKGEWIWGKRSERKDKEEIRCTCPPIVTSEVWNKAQEVLKKNRLFEPSAVRHKYLLRGLVSCKYCNHNFCGYYARLYNGNERRYYRCNGKTQSVRMKETPCDSPTVNADSIENYVWNKIAKYIQKPEVIIANLNKKRDAYRGLEISQELVDIEKNIIEIENQLTNFIKMQSMLKNVDMNSIDELAQKSNHDKDILRARQNRLRAELEDENEIGHNIDEFEKWLNKIQSHLNNPTWEEKREIVIYLVDRIIVSKGEVDGVTHPIADIFFKFQDISEIENDSVILDLTDAHADIMAMHTRPAPAHRVR